METSTCCRGETLIRYTKIIFRNLPVSSINSEHINICTVKGKKYSTTMNFTHYIPGNYCRKNLLELKNNIEIYEYHKIG